MQSLYYKMLRIRMVEEKIANRYPEEEMRCPVHLSIGQEAAAVGVGHALTKDDLMVSTHRGHAHYLAKGGDLLGLIAELYGRQLGCSGGQGGSMHLVDWDCGFAGSTSIVGGTIPIGVGLAFAKKLKKKPGIVVICFGDAAVEEGVFHESCNLAAIHNLPVAFLCENNLYSCYTHIANRQPIGREITDLAKAHGLNCKSFDGNDVTSVFDLSSTAFNSIRAGGGPALFELTTYRHLEHCGPHNDDDLGYREPDERRYWLKHDPLLITQAQMEKAGEWTDDVLGFRQTIETEIRLAFKLAKASPFPDPAALGRWQYAGT